ncbi:MAG TPA: hypothetical protein VHU82_13470 [Vicinamibacterales bacterium]|nr:hypothetical protein [Vicinamibacterales bacterium]
MLCGSTVLTAAASLSSDAARAWTTYVSATESRIASELASSKKFLAIDFDPDGATERRAVRGGTIVIRRIETLDARGGRMSAPSARIHHWRGDVLIRGVTVAQLMDRLESGALPTQDDVERGSVLEREPGRLKLYLRLRRKMLVTVVYNTEHVATFTRYGGSRATSTSVATKIAELADPDTVDERELSAGNDRGFLWGLRAYWRYEEVAGGAIAECESLALSRDAPALVRYLVDPLIESTARESMARTLNALSTQFGHP